MGEFDYNAKAMGDDRRVGMDLRNAQGAQNAALNRMPGPPQRDTLYGLSGENMATAHELMSRISTAADVVGGSIPQSSDKPARDVGPESLLGVQQEIRRTLRLCIEHMVRLESATH